MSIVCILFVIMLGNVNSNCRKKVVRSQTKLNPLKNMKAMNKLNPYAIVTRRAAILREEALKRARASAAKGVSTQGY